ncbi:hypothetical protein MSG28_014728, partial [Choristoneura fumiferana]
MMDFDEIVVKESPGLCRCCLSEGCYKDLGSEYSWMSETEIYADMLLECFDISISQHPSGPNGSNRLICEVCITRLRDACNFKKQVLESEKRFVDMVGRGEFRPKEDLLKNEDYGEPSVSEDITVSALAVKGKRGRPKKSSTAVKPEKKAKVPKLEEKPTKSKAVAKDDIPHKKACELAAGRRKNLQTLFRNSRVIPFQWRGHYACIYCSTSCLTYDDLVKHINSHDKSLIEKYLAERRLKTTLKLDVSDMSCQLCDDRFKTLDALIDHLVTKHDLKYDRQVQMLIEQYKLLDLSCPLCEENFSEMAFLNFHVNSRHADNFQCEYCSEMFQKKKDLKLHNKLFHTDPYDDQIEICVKEEP